MYNMHTQANDIKIMSHMLYMYINGYRDFLNILDARLWRLCHVQCCVVTRSLFSYMCIHWQYISKYNTVLGNWNPGHAILRHLQCKRGHRLHSKLQVEPLPVPTWACSNTMRPIFIIEVA